MHFLDHKKSDLLDQKLSYKTHIADYTFSREKIVEMESFLNP